VVCVSQKGLLRRLFCPMRPAFFFEVSTWLFVMCAPIFVVEHRTLVFSILTGDKSISASLQGFLADCDGSLAGHLPPDPRLPLISLLESSL